MISGGTSYSISRGIEKDLQMLHKKVAIVLIALGMVLSGFALPSVADVNNLEGNQSNPSAIVGPDGVVYVVYKDERDGDSGDIYLAKSFDGGVTFTDPADHILVYDDSPSTGPQDQPSIAVDSAGNLYVIFVAASSHLLYFTWSQDGGLTFSDIVKISDAPIGTSNVAQYPNICVDDRGDDVRAYVGWRDQRTGIPKAMFTVVTVSGNISWQENRYIFGDPNSAIRQSTPDLAVDKSGTLYAAWHDDSEGDLNVYWARSLDYGDSFEFLGRADDAIAYPGTDQAQPSIAVDSVGTVYMTYVDGRTGYTNESVGFARAPFNGAFGQHSLIAPPNGCTSPIIEILDGGLIFVMYSEIIEIGHETYRGMFYTSSLDGGLSWRPWNPRVQVDQKKVGIENYNQCIVPQDTGDILMVWEAFVESLGKDVVSDIIIELVPSRLECELVPGYIKALEAQVIGFNLTVLADGSIPVDSCTVQFSSDNGGTFSDVMELGNGQYHVDYTVPALPADTKISIHVQVSKAGYPDSGTMGRVAEDEVPIPVIDGPASGSINTPISFSGVNSNDPDGVIISYDWDFGDGSTDSGVDVEHSWSSTETYVVTLTVTDDWGVSNSTTHEITIEAILVLTLQMDKVFMVSEGTANVTVEVTCNGLPVENVFVEASMAIKKSKVTVNPKTNYTDADGRSHILLTCRRISGSSPEILEVIVTKDGYTYAFESLDFYVLVPPNAEFSYFFGSPQVTFDASASYDPDGEIVSYDWDFGDGSTGVGEIVVHNYYAPGDYLVVLTVTDNEGASDTAIQVVTVGPTATLSVEILPLELPIPSDVTTDIEVIVTSSSNPVEGAAVTLTCSFPATIAPSQAFTDANGVAMFTFLASARRDTMITLSAVASKDGYESGSADREVKLNYPDLYVYYTLENMSVMACESIDVILTVVNRTSAPIPSASVRIYPEDGYVEPILGETDSSGEFLFTFTAPIVEGQPREITIGSEVSKFGYDPNNTANCTITVLPVPVLYVDATIESSVFFWYDEILIDAVVTSSGTPQEGVPVSATFLSGAGSLNGLIQYSDANGFVQFVYTTPMIITSNFVAIRLIANQSGYIDGECVVQFVVKAPATELIFIDYPAGGVAPGARFDVTVRAVDERMDPIEAVAVYFNFSSEISNQVSFDRTDMNGYANSRATAPMTDVPIELNITVSLSTKGYIETYNWTIIMVDPALASGMAVPADDGPFADANAANFDVVAILLLLMVIVGIACYLCIRQESFLKLRCKRKNALDF